jgi:hypothetical protein
MKKYRYLYLLGVILFVTTGCNMLPAGKPPEGDIINTQINKIKTSEHALNHMITSLIAFTISEIPGTEIKFHGNSKDSIAKAIYVLKETGKTTNIAPTVKKSNYLLHANIVKNSWHWKLFFNKKVIWEEKILVEK